MYHIENKNNKKEILTFNRKQKKVYILETKHRAVIANNLKNKTLILIVLQIVFFYDYERTD